MKAFAYLRVSGKGQVDGDGFPRQLAAIEKYAAANGVEVVRVFEEKGISGDIDGPGRPTWAEMIEMILSNGVRTIIVEKLDRLARQQGLQEYMLYDMRKRGISVVSTHEDDLESEDPTRVLFRQLMGAIAQYDKSMIVLKLRGSRQRKKAATGRCEGGKPFGHYPGEASVLERIRSLRLAGVSAKKIATTLNLDLVPSRSGGRWHPYTVSKILGREVCA